MTIAEVRERTAGGPSSDDDVHRGGDVCIPLEELDGLVRDLYSVGLTLARLGRDDPAGTAGDAAHALAVLDRVITRVHMAAAELTPGEFHDQTRTGGEPDTIELLDAAHSARRARAILEEALSPAS